MSGSGADAQWDAIVVGSGFGGAVTGARLAERGLRVLILERGPWWGAGGQGRPAARRRELPHGGVGLGRLLRGVDYARGRRSRRLTVGRYGLFELHLFERMLCAVASGVGGGSHVYTNMQVQPGDDFFDAFPAGIDAAEMRPHFDAVRAMLEPRPVAEPPLKARAFERALAAAGLGAPTYPDLAISAGEEPRRRTLDLTYLPLAERHGAEIRSLCEVRAIGRERGGYAVRFDDLARRSTELACAPRLVLAAGTLGTLRLLFAARDRERTLPGLPASLGRGFTPNGDIAAAVHRAADPVESDRGPLICAYRAAQGETGHHRRLVAEVGLPLDAVPLPTAARRRLARSLLLFGMGRDRIAARVGFDGRELRIDAGRGDDAALFDELEDTMRAIARGYRPRRFITGFPFRSGSDWLLSVHPLGGAALADSPQAGVVGPDGEVFGHPGLFVADGSLYPEAPGIPPSLTIAALAERNAAFVAAVAPDPRTPRERSLM